MRHVVDDVVLHLKIQLPCSKVHNSALKPDDMKTALHLFGKGQHVWLS